MLVLELKFDLVEIKMSGATYEMKIVVEITSNTIINRNKNCGSHFIHSNLVSALLIELGSENLKRIFSSRSSLMVLLMEPYYLENQKFLIKEIRPLYHHRQCRFLSNEKL